MAFAKGSYGTEGKEKAAKVTKGKRSMNDEEPAEE